MHQEACRVMTNGDREDEVLNPPVNGKIQGLFKANLIFKTFQDSPVYSSTFQACANPVKTLAFSVY